MAQVASLQTLYLQIEYANTPSAVLGVSENASETEVHDAYRAIALKIHPDKAPSENLREIHTSRFQKLQAAHVTLTKAREINPYVQTTSRNQVLAPWSQCGL